MFVQLVGWLVGWLFGWLHAWLAGWLVGWLHGWFGWWFDGCFVVCSVCWLAGSFDLFVGWLVGLFVCSFWLVVWLVG